MLATQKPDVWANGLEKLKDTPRCLAKLTNNKSVKGNTRASVERRTVSVFSISLLFFTCQADFDAGPVPPSPRIRHHSGRNDQTNFPSESPKRAVSPLNGDTNGFSAKSCALFLFSSRVKMYYFTAKSCAPSKSNNTGEHFRAGSGTQ